MDEHESRTVEPLVVGGRGTVPPPPLKLRVEQSPTIVTGQVVSVSDEAIVIEVSDVIRGSIGPGDRVEVNRQVPPAVGPVAVGDEGVWLVSGVGNPPGLLGGGPAGVTLDEVLAVLPA